MFNEYIQKILIIAFQKQTNKLVFLNIKMCHLHVTKTLMTFAPSVNYTYATMNNYDMTGHSMVNGIFINLTEPLKP